MQDLNHAVDTYTLIQGAGEVPCKKIWLPGYVSVSIIILLASQYQ